MIEKQRLEELIKQKATIYTSDEWVCDYTFEEDYHNSHNRKYEITDNFLSLVVDDPYVYDDVIWCWDLESLFETKEEAEWYLEFGNIERTEKLTLPTWEELFNQDRCLDCYTKEFSITKDGVVIGICLFGVDFTNKVIDVGIGEDRQFVGELTKENYLEACRLAKKLFLGEEV